MTEPAEHESRLAIERYRRQVRSSLVRQAWSERRMVLAHDADDPLTLPDHLLRTAQGGLAGIIDEMLMGDTAEILKHIGLDPAPIAAMEISFLESEELGPPNGLLAGRGCSQARVALLSALSSGPGTSLSGTAPHSLRLLRGANLSDHARRVLRTSLRHLSLFVPEPKHVLAVAAATGDRSHRWPATVVEVAGAPGVQIVVQISSGLRDWMIEATLDPSTGRALPPGWTATLRIQDMTGHELLCVAPTEDVPCVSFVKDLPTGVQMDAWIETGGKQ